MSREILFRGKRVDNGEWVEGFYLVLPIGETVILSNKGYANVIPETVGQYTGLTDKNGKKIFEWDIVRGKDWCGIRREGSVEYNDYGAHYVINPNTKSKYRDSDTEEHLCPAEEYLEIIGNLWDNPELLEVEE